jgi:hypothetical protein
MGGPSGLPSCHPSDYWPVSADRSATAGENGRRRLRADELPALCSALACNVFDLYAGWGEVEDFGGFSLEMARWYMWGADDDGPDATLVERPPTSYQ